MEQWFDEVLIAIEQQENGKYKVLELPRCVTTFQRSRRSFAHYEDAELYIAQQYDQSQIIAVEPEDITEEIERRAAIIAKAEQEEQEDEPHYETDHYWEERRAIERDWPIAY